MTQKYSLGLIKDKPDRRDFLLQKSIDNNYSINDLPDVVDYTSEMSPVKDQGYMGACVGFATAAVKEWQERKEYLTEKKRGSKYKRDEEYNLSESWIYWNCKKIDPWPNEEGTTIRAAMKVLNQLGVPSEKAWPYTDDKNNIGEPARWSKMTAQWKKIKSYYRITNLSDLIYHLYKYGPVVSGLLVFDSIMKPGSDGFVNMPSRYQNPIGGHAVAICGYTKHGSNNYLIFKNSWTKEWGNGGYGKIQWKYFENYNMDTWSMTDWDVKKTDIKKFQVLK